MKSNFDVINYMKVSNVVIYCYNLKVCGSSMIFFYCICRLYCENIYFVKFI